MVHSVICQSIWPDCISDRENLFTVKHLLYVGILLTGVAHANFLTLDWATITVPCSWQMSQSLHCLHAESLETSLPIKCTAKTLIRQGRRPGWSESFWVHRSFCWFCHAPAQTKHSIANPGLFSYAMQAPFGPCLSVWSISYKPLLKLPQTFAV